MGLSLYWTDQATMELDFLLQSGVEREVEYVVLGLARMMYTLEHRDAVTDEEAGLYALNHLPAEWHRILQEALRISQNRLYPSFYGTDKQRTAATKNFTHFIVEYCNQKHQLF